MNVTVEMLEKLTTQLPDVFDTHEAIQAIMREAPREYADDLGATPGADPIHTYHTMIGKLLLQVKGLEKLERVNSDNVRGNKTGNQQWRKTQLV